MGRRRGVDLVWLGCLVAVMALGAWWLRGRSASNPVAPEPQKVAPVGSPSPSPADLNWLRRPDPQAVVLHTHRGNIVFELYPNAAPHHVARIKELVLRGYYNGLLFHRVIPQFMIQFGDPNTRNHNRSLWGTGGDDQPPLKAEFNALPHDLGAVSMARATDPDTATTQFFICVGPVAYLNGQYTVFGHVIQGQDVAEAISRVGRDTRDAPLSDERVEQALLEPHP